jgi:glycosyltransferase involved in cell wall biosynthesis
MLDPWSLSQKRWKKQTALVLGYRTLLRRAAFLHVLNRDEEKLLRPLRLGVPTAILPNGVFLDELEPLPSRGTFRARHPELGSAPYVLFLSRMHYKKGLDVLAHAFERLAAVNADVRLVVAGPDQGAGPAFVQAIARAGLQHRVHLIGPLYGEAKLAAFVDAACFCLPSRQEGFSVAITEALACGVPVVITQACHFPEVAEVGAGSIVELDPAAIADALSLILQVPARAAAMGAAGAALVRERYTWPRIAEATLLAYQSVRSLQTERSEGTGNAESG